MEYHLEIKQIESVEDDHGSHLAIKMISLYKDGKYVKHVKLNDELIEKLKTAKITIDV